MRLRLTVVAALACCAIPCSAQLIAPNLMFNAIAPCRILDTRLGGGVLAANTTRQINVVGLTDYSAQGGFAGDCHIPGFTGGGAHVQAVMVNFIAVSSGGAGDLRAWPTDQATPTASIINYASTSSNHGLNLANGLVLPVRQDSQGGDITIRADVSSTHVVADITGYFSAETDPAGGNLFLGQNAGSITVASGGTLNVGVGDQVLKVNTSGCHDVAVGAESMAANGGGSYTVAVGYNTLNVHTNGDDNVAVGAESLEADQSGSNNTAVGAQALNLNTTGSNNIAVGSSAGTANSPAAAANIDIGSVGNAADSGTIRLGDTQTKAFVAGIRGVQTATNDAVAVVIDSHGQLGTVSSSRTVKEDIEDMADQSRRLLDLRPVVFRYRQAFADGTKPIQYGLIAEEVADAFPDLVARNAAGQPETVKYQVLPTLLLNELQRQARALQDQRRDLEGQLMVARSQASEAQSRAERFEHSLAAQEEEISTLRRTLTDISQRSTAAPAIPPAP
jgi:hypothetical protein